MLGKLTASECWASWSMQVGDQHTACHKVRPVRPVRPGDFWQLAVGTVTLSMLEGTMAAVPPSSQAETLSLCSACLGPHLHLFLMLSP